MKAVFEFLASKAGRVVRAVVGILIIVVGVVFVQETTGWILVIIGLVPLAAGVFDFCVFAPLFSLPFMGKALRKALGK